jgi:hypothetical protein
VDEFIERTGDVSLRLSKPSRTGILVPETK